MEALFQRNETRADIMETYLLRQGCHKDAGLREKGDRPVDSDHDSPPAGYAVPARFVHDAGHLVAAV